jgi:inner membrane protein
MNAVTHVIGGAVFAGTMCSFSDVNIFENPLHIGVCVAFALLPDIDTTKSLIGKFLYPVAWIINRKFGHRTITHSLLFILGLWLVFFALRRFGIYDNPNIVKIALFSVLSHFVLDMLTVSGIPLLFPFFHNPCVIPGNKNFRFATGDMRSELVICGICGLLCITMQPLFANGFWTSYNRQFGTIKHVARENNNTEFYVVCEYSYIKNAEIHEGEALVITSKTNEITLFDREKIFVLNDEDPQLKVNYVS